MDTDIPHQQRLARVKERVGDLAERFHSATGAPRSWLDATEGLIRRRAFPAAVTITVGLFAIFWWTLTPAFNTNDDVHMMWIADGTFYHQPSQHLIATNVLIGRVLSFLYELAPGINWYSWYLYAVHIIAFFAVTWVVLSDRRFRLLIHLPALSGIFVLFYLWSWMNLQFTSASLLLGVAGLILFVTKAPLDQVPTWLIASSGALLGVASWIRVESFVGLIVMAVPLAAVVRDIPWRRVAVFVGVALLTSLFAYGFEKIDYAGEQDWQAYREFNQVRGDLIATPRIDGLASRGPLLEEIGWSRNDALMFRYWFFMDPDVHSTDALLKIRAATEGQRRDLEKLGELVERFRSQRWTTLRLLLLGGLFAFAMVDGGWRRRVLGLGVVIWVTGMGLYLLLTLRWPARVNVPMMAFVALTLLLVPLGSNRETPKSEATTTFRGLRFTGVALLLLTIALTVPRGLGWLVNSSSNNAHKPDNLRMTIDDLRAVDDDGIFVTRGPVLGSSRAAVKSRMEIPLDMIHLGWQARSPIYMDHLQSHGISDVYEAIALRGDVYLVVRSARSWAQLFETYVEEHYGWVGQLRPAGLAGSGLKTVAYDRLVDYRYSADGTHLVELSPDGSERRIPIDFDERVGCLGQAQDAEEQGGPSGWAADPSTGAGPDYVIAMDDGTLARMVAPNAPRETVSANPGSGQGDDLIGFDLLYSPSDPAPPVLRVFAVFGDRAQELQPCESSN